jgi:hypothetical protein
MALTAVGRNVDEVAILLDIRRARVRSELRAGTAALDAALRTFSPPTTLDPICDCLQP